MLLVIRLLYFFILLFIGINHTISAQEKSEANKGYLEEIKVFDELNYEIFSLKKMATSNLYTIVLSHLYLQNMAMLDFTAVKITILGVDSKTAEYEDTCISAVDFYVKDKLLKTIKTEEYNKIKN